MPNQHSPNLVSEQTQTCIYCKKQFHDYRIRKYCSLKCWHLARSATVPITQCLQCGNPIRATKKGESRKKFCNLECRSKYMIAENHPNWTGGRGTEKSTGYIRVSTGRNKRNREHRVKMESHVGRLLRSDEEVHHKNLDKTDNRIENLEILTKPEHARLHQSGRPPAPLIVCRRCGRTRKHGAKGLCRSCYTRSNLESRLAVDPENVRARLLEQKRQSYARKKKRSP
jgi:hypothetical protein